MFKLIINDQEIFFNESIKETFSKLIRIYYARKSIGCEHCGTSGYFDENIVLCDECYNKVIKMENLCVD